MAVIEWDTVGERFYQSGLDRGVLYLNDGTAVPWNGLTSLEDNTKAELKSYYLDGVKILDHVIPGDYEGKLSAITYPEEFDTVLGIVSVSAGLSFYDQEYKSFNLSYRTKIGNDIDENYGYKIHLLYNLKAIPDSQRFESISDQPAISQFAWTLSGSPPISTLDEVRPTVHLSIDSIDAIPEVFQALENILYGTESTNPRFPTILEVKVLFGSTGSLYIVDNGNGTWTAIDPSDNFIEEVDSESFLIDHANVVYSDPDTYDISDTEVPLP